MVWLVAQNSDRGSSELVKRSNRFMMAYSNESEPRGWDTVLFSANRASGLMRQIAQAISERWDDCLIETDIDNTQQTLRCLDFSNIDHSVLDSCRHSVVTFSKDEEMADFFHDVSYRLMDCGEGSFSYHLRDRTKILFELTGVTEVVRGAGETMAVRPYNAWFCSASILELTAVTPGDPKTDPFSEWVVKTLINACLR